MLEEQSAKTMHQQSEMRGYNQWLTNVQELIRVPNHGNRVTNVGKHIIEDLSAHPRSRVPMLNLNLPKIASLPVLSSLTQQEEGNSKTTSGLEGISSRMELFHGNVTKKAISPLVVKVIVVLKLKEVKLTLLYVKTYLNLSQTPLF